MAHPGFISAFGLEGILKGWKKGKGKLGRVQCIEEYKRYWKFWLYIIQIDKLVIHYKLQLTYQSSHEVPVTTK